MEIEPSLSHNQPILPLVLPPILPLVLPPILPLVRVESSACDAEHITRCVTCALLTTAICIRARRCRRGLGRSRGRARIGGDFGNETRQRVLEATKLQHHRRGCRGRRYRRRGRRRGGRGGRGATSLIGVWSLVLAGSAAALPAVNPIALLHRCPQSLDELRLQSVCRQPARIQLRAQLGHS